MYKKIIFLAVIAPLILATHCRAERYKPVTFNREFIGVETGYSNVFQLCFDRSGAVYPEPAGEYLVTPGDQSMFRDLYQGKVEDYFRKNRVTENYAEKEPEVLAEYARTVSDYLAANRGARVLFFIHDFDNTFKSATEDYEAIENKIMRLDKDQEYLFIRVYWDGLAKTWIGGEKGLDEQWNRACHQSAVVGGYGLRRFLNLVYNEEISDAPIYFLSHGRGAAVIAGALWEYTSPTSRRAIEPRTHGFSNIRIGMLAPSLGKHAFDTVTEKTARKFVIGFNHQDRLNHRFSHMPPGFYGSTKFGSLIRIYRYVSERIGGAMEKIDFLGKKHDLSGYLSKKNGKFANEFLPLLFSGGQASADQ